MSRKESRSSSARFAAGVMELAFAHPAPVAAGCFQLSLTERDDSGFFWTNGGDMNNQAEQTDGDDACKMRHAVEHLKMAAQLLYKVGKPECVRIGEKTDDVLRELIPILAREELPSRLADILRGFAKRVVAIIERAHNTEK